MGAATNANETAGINAANDQPFSGDPSPITDPKHIRIITLPRDESDIDEAEWLRWAATNPAFDFLRDPVEDIYSIQDGKPFHDLG